VFSVMEQVSTLNTGVPDPTEKTIERSPLFVRHGGHCCGGDLVGRTTYWIVFEWLAGVSLVAV